MGLLRGERPGDGVLGEEGAGAAGASGLEWVVDPLDGTVNFLYGIPQWAVSVACRDARDTLAAVVYDALHGETFAAASGSGCTLNGWPLQIATAAAARARPGGHGLLLRGRRARAADGAVHPRPAAGAGHAPRRARPRSTWPGSRPGASTPSTSTASRNGTMPRVTCSCARRAASWCRCRPPAGCARASSRARSRSRASSCRCCGIGWRREHRTRRRDPRRRARPRAGPARRRHGAVGDPLRRPGRPPRRARAGRARPRHGRGGSDRGARRRRRPRQVPRPDPRRVRPDRAVTSSPARGRASCRSCSAATTRSRSGVFGGLARVHGPVGVIWFDAHADCNTPETTPSGNVHGMGLSGALGWNGELFAGGDWPVPSVDEERTVLIGVRALDPGERERLRRVAGARVHDLRRRPARHGGGHPRRAGARARLRRTSTSRSTWT